MLKPDWTGLSLQQLMLKPDWTGLSLQQLMLKLYWIKFEIVGVKAGLD